MRGVNKVMLVGNLGRDPDLQYIEGEIPVAKFPLATTEMRKEKNGNLVSDTEWHTVVLWRGLAELAGKYLHKGSLVYIEGKLRTRSWEDKDKNKRFQTEIVADNLVMLEKRKDSDHYVENSHGNGSGAKTIVTDDDLDFGFSKEDDDISSNILPF
ncbi:MAG: single-stranded DNA-binding protein [Edaphocola sp.]